MLKNWLRKHPFALAVVGFLVTWFVLEYIAGLLGLTEELAEGELLSIYRVALCLFAAARLFKFDRFTSDERVIWTYCLVGLTVCVVYIELIYLIDVPEYAQVGISTIGVVAIAYFLGEKGELRLRINRLKDKYTDNSESTAHTKTDQEGEFDSLAGGELYDRIWIEIEAGAVDNELWDKLAEEYRGDERKTKAAYLSERAQQLRES